MSESLRTFEDQQLYKGIELVEVTANKFAVAKVEIDKLEIQIEKFTVQIEKLGATIRDWAKLRASIDAVIFKAYGVMRGQNETTYDCLGRVYKLRSDQVQLYVEMRAAGSEHAEAERAALAKRPQ